MNDSNIINNYILSLFYEEKMYILQYMKRKLYTIILLSIYLRMEVNTKTLYYTVHIYNGYCIPKYTSSIGWMIWYPYNMSMQNQFIIWQVRWRY